MKHFDKALELARQVESIYVRPAQAEHIKEMVRDGRKDTKSFHHNPLWAIHIKLYRLMVAIGKLGPYCHEMDEAALATCVWLYQDLKDSGKENDLGVQIEGVWYDMVMCDERHPMLRTVESIALPQEVCWIQRFLVEHPEFDNDPANELFGVINDQSKLRWHLTRQLDSYYSKYQKLELAKYDPFCQQRLTIVSQGIDYPGDKPDQHHQQTVLDGFRHRIGEMRYKPKFGDVEYIPNITPGVDVLSISKVEIAFTALSKEGQK